MSCKPEKWTATQHFGRRSPINLLGSYVVSRDTTSGAVHYLSLRRSRARMSTPITYAPPGRVGFGPDRGRVSRRHVLYAPGYDPQAKTRARALFIRELGRYARRFGIIKRMSPARDLPDAPVMRWTVATSRDDWRVETTYDVLLWDDIVQSDFARPKARFAADAASVAAWSLMTGVAARLFRMKPLFGGVFAYPYMMLILLPISAVAAGILGYHGARLLNAPTWFAATMGAAAGLAAGIALARRYSGYYVWHLLRDWIFAYEHGAGERSDYSDRVDLFAQHLCRVAAETKADEVLVVGHSSGATTAMETAARALALDPDLGRHGPEVTVLTIGTSLPAAAFNPRADTIHAELRRLMTSPDVLWVEYQAPQDWLNAAWFNPVRMLPLGLAEEQCTNPVIRSAKFKELVTEETYGTMRFNPFRMHFQFMMANDWAGEYDYFMIVLGPWRLSARVADPDGAIRLVAPVTDRLETASDTVASLTVDGATH